MNAYVVVADENTYDGEFITLCIAKDEEAARENAYVVFKENHGRSAKKLGVEFIVETLKHYLEFCPHGIAISLEQNTVFIPTDTALL